MPVEPATLTGLGIGDALGMPFETHTPFSQALLEWDGSFLSGATNDLQPERQPGEWTDDTKMAIALAESLIESDTYNPVVAARLYMEWYQSGDHRGMGKATREAMDRLILGHHWNQSGVLHAKGNGTAMRIAPLGLYYRKSLSTIADMARVDARITHRDIEAEEGSVIVALAVGLLAEATVPKNSLLGPLLNLIHSGSRESTVTLLESRLVDLQGYLKQPYDAKTVLTRLIEGGTGARVAETVPAALLCFITTESFKDAVELAVRAGGDTDTTAAITGALAGTYYGTEAVEPYLEQLEGAVYLQHLDHLLYLAAPNIPDDT
jgi:ADP-ribosyl-[dinitrogen reductase] hydrolase